MSEAKRSASQLTAHDSCIKTLCRRFLTRCGLFGLAAAMTAASGCASLQQERNPAAPPLIGVVLPLSGADKEYGKQILSGIQLAAARIKELSGIDVTMPRLVVIDDGGSGAKADAAVRRLAADGAAIALVGYSSHEVLAVKSAAAELRLPVLSPAGSNDLITERNPYMFRMNFSDKSQAQALAYYAFYMMQMRRMATMLDLDENAVYARDFGRQTAQAFADYGGELVFSAGFQGGDRDFSKVVTDILETSPDTVFVPAYPATAGRIVRELRKQNFRGLILGGDGWQGENFFKECGDNVGKVAASAVYTPELNTPEQLEFRQRFRAKYGFEPGVNEALGYDAMLVAYMAVRNTAGAEDVLAKLGQIRSFSGGCGMARVMPSGDTRRTVFINEVKVAPDGKKYFKLSKSISPDRITRIEEDVKRSF